MLAYRFPDAAIQGLDSSEDMVDAASKRLPAYDFFVASIEDWSAPDPVDVILANASLQWLRKHEGLYPRLVEQLKNGCCLAVQTPDNLEKPAHRIARELATEDKWSAKIRHVSHPDRHQADWYYALLKPRCTNVDVWRTVYSHALDDHQAVVEWFKGSALRPFLLPLTEAERVEFLDT